MITSFNFPDMLSSTSARLLTGHEATASNYRLLLKSNKYSLFGDPYYGASFRKLLFEQNNAVLRDLVIDMIMVCTQTFMPQLKVTRKDITVVSDKSNVYTNVRAVNLLDFTTDMFNIKLIGDE